MLFSFLHLLLTNEKVFCIHCLGFLSLRGGRLDLSLALVVGRSDASERVGFLLLYFLVAGVSMQNVFVRNTGTLRTLRYSLEASCHSRVMVCGAGLANMRMVAKMVREAPRPART